MMRVLIPLTAYAMAVWLATVLLAHAYAPADQTITPPPPRPPMTCIVVQGQIKCEVK